MVTDTYLPSTEQTNEQTKVIQELNSPGVPESLFNEQKTRSNAVFSRKKTS